MAKFAADDRVEQMNDQKRRLKVQTHKREVERLLLKRRAMYDKEQQKEVVAMAKQQIEQEKRAILVREEKHVLLREHASKYPNPSIMVMNPFT